MGRFRLLAISLIAVLFAAACAKPPDPLVQQAESALQAAQDSGAPKYAPDAWSQAQQAMDQLKAELAAQKKAFSLFRSYASARTLAEAALKAAQKAESEALAGKKLADDAAAAVADLRRLLRSARDRLAALPRTIKLDTASLKAMLDSAGRQLDQAQADLSAGRFDGALATAAQARGTVTRVLTEIEKATGRPASKKR